MNFQPSSLWSLLRILAVLLACGAVEAQTTSDPRLDTPLPVEALLYSDVPAAATELQRLQHAATTATAEESAQLRHLEAKLALEQRRPADALASARLAGEWISVHGSPRQRSRLAWLDARIQIELRAAPERIDAAFAAAEAAATAADDLWVVANVWLLRAYRHSESSQFEDAQRDGRKALEWARRLGWKPLIALVLNNLGNAEKNLGHMGDGLALHLEALQLRREASDDNPRDRAAIVQSLSNIVLVYQRLEDWPLAEQYSREAYQRALQLDDRPQLVRIALNHASVRLEHDGAAAAHEVLQLLDGLGDLESLREQVPRMADVLIRNALSTRASALALAGAPEQAIAPAQAAVSLARTMTSGKELAEALNTLAEVHMSLQPAQLDVAVRSLREAAALAVQLKALPLERQLRKALADALERQGELKSALEERRSYERIGDLIHNTQSARRIAALEQQVADAQRENEIAQLRIRESLQGAQISRQRWIGGMGGITLLAIALALYFRIRYARKREESLAQQNVLLEKLATTDALTSLRNRQWMWQQLELAFAAQTPDQPTCVALLDIDFFKQINDKHGHDMGDAVLVRLARLLQSALPTGWKCARWGGEEFLLLAPPGCFGAAAVEELQALCRKVASSTEFPDGLRVTCSIGVADRNGAATVAAWLKAADLALYAVKAGGRNGVKAAGG